MISPRYFANVLISILPSQQFGEQVRIAGYIIQAFRHRVMANIIEIRANSDMIDACNIPKMIDVVGNLGDGWSWVGILVFPLPYPFLDCLIGIEASVQFGKSLGSLLLPGRVFRRDKFLDEVGVHHAAVGSEFAKNIIG